MKEQKQERQNTNNIMEMEAKVLAHQRNLASNECKYKKLEGQHNILVEFHEVLEAKLIEEVARVQEVCRIRHTEQRWLFPILSLVLPFDVFARFRGKPLKGTFVRHCRTLFATGSSARSVREQLFVNATFFLSVEGYGEFMESMPELRWFQTQREGLGNESMLYSFMAIAMCDEVVQWGFDETSSNGIPPTLN
jgi:hypothetical protein